MLLVSASNVYTQKNYSGKLSEQKLVQAFDNLLKLKSVRFEDNRITNGDTFDSVYEFLYPNKYHLKQHKVQKGKEIYIDWIIIGNTLFEKENDKWLKQNNSNLSGITIETVKTVSKTNNFAVSKDDSLEVIELENKETDEDIILLEYTFKTGFLPTKGKVWIKNNLPIRHTYETLPGCINKMSGETVYDYESKITITNPLMRNK